MKTDEYYYCVKELQKWQEKERREGSNYVTKTYIEKYEAILDNLNPQPKNPKLKLDPPKTNKQMDDEYKEMIRKLVKSLKRRIELGKYSWQDLFLLDIYSGKPSDEWRLPI